MGITRSEAKTCALRAGDDMGQDLPRICNVDEPQTGCLQTELKSTARYGNNAFNIPNMVVIGIHLRAIWEKEEARKGAYMALAHLTGRKFVQPYEPSTLGLTTCAIWTYDLCFLDLRLV